jgi:hypothetical protein
MAGGPPENMPIFTYLVSLDISANVGTATRILHPMVASRYLNLRNLTLHFLDDSFDAGVSAINARVTSSTPSITINTRLVGSSQLEGLALYGRPVAAVLSSWALWWNLQSGGPYELAKLRTLAIEEDSSTILQVVDPLDFVSTFPRYLACVETLLTPY